MSTVIQQSASYQDGLRLEQWTRSLSQQIGTWRLRVTETLGVSASVGVALGGVAAAATGAAVAIVQG